MVDRRGDQHTVALIQARYGSSRLPGKVLAMISGRTMLAHVIERVRATTGIDEVVVATTTDPEDLAVYEEAISQGAGAFRGSSHDVLDRFYQAAIVHGADNVVRVTADCPLLDPILVAQIIDYFWENRLDYCSNLIPATFPDGLSAEILTFSLLEQSWNEATLPSDREHVTTYIRTHLDKFRAENFEAPEDFANYRWTVDEKEDLEVIRRLFVLLDQKPGEFREWQMILRLVNDHPEISELNAHHKRYEGWDRSRAVDRQND